MSATGTVAAIEMGLLPFGVDPFRAGREQGLRTLLVTADPGGYRRSATARASIERYVDEVVAADTTSPAAIIAALAGRPPDGVFSVNDYSVVAVAEVAHHFGLPGLRVAAAGNARDKLRCRRLCTDAGVPVPRWAWVRSAAEAARAATEIGPPCVVKPMSEAASIGVRLCRAPDEAARHYEVLAATTTDRRGQPRPPGALVEEYLLGCEVSVEVLYLDGAHRVVGVTDKSLGPHPHFVEVGEAFPSVLPRSTQDACARVAIGALRAIGHDFGAAHVEVKVTAAGPRLVEVNARMPGAQITRLIHEATGVNLPAQAIRLHTGRPASLAATRGGGAASRCLSSPRRGVVAAVHGADLARAVAGVVQVALYVAPGDRVRPARSNLDAAGHVVAAAGSTGEAVRLAETALGQLHLDLAADPADPDPAHPDPAHPDPAHPDPAHPDPAHPDPARPGPHRAGSA
jgi:biotin carboxylase